MTLRISGDSYPENSFAFYAPLFDWLGPALGELPGFRLEVNVGYMNSSSTKCMLDILDLLCEAGERGCEVSVLWWYDAGNERALDLAEEFSEDIDIPFVISPLPAAIP
jgi:hypothetical protein